MVYSASGRHDVVHPMQQLVVVSLDDFCSVLLNLNKEELVVMFIARAVEKGGG